MFFQAIEEAASSHGRGRSSHIRRGFRPFWLFFLVVSSFGLAACNDVSTAPTPDPPAPTPAPPPPVFGISTASPINGTINNPFHVTLAVEAGTPPYTWSIIGNEPPGPNLTLNSTTGVISGTPTGPSTSTIVTTRTYLVIDSTTPTAQVTQKALTISINAATPGSSSASGSLISFSPPSSQPIIAPFSLQNGTVNVTYPNIQLTATGGKPPYTWSVSPPLPNGLFLNLLGPGVLSGTPLIESGGVTTHTFKVIDSTVPTGQTSELTRNLTINATLTIDVDPPTGISLPNASAGQPYNATLFASGGTGPGTYTWSIVGNLLPAPGLPMLSPDGVLSGIPTVPGTFARAYRVQDNNGVAVTKSLFLTVNSALTIDTDNGVLPLPAGIVGQSYDAGLMASGGSGPRTYTWSLASDAESLPEGLTLNGTGRIVGIPAVAGIFSPTFRVADTTSSAEKRVSMTVR
jgi:hypothetical protein